MCGRAPRRTVGGTVGRMREELGQIGGEMLGVLLLVSLVIGALSSSGAVETVADETSRLVCVIGGGTDCGAEPEPEPEPGPEAKPTPGPGGGDTDEGGEPPQGLPIGDQDVPVLPFPGSITVHCTFVDGQGRPCGGSDASVSVQADASTTVRRSATTTNAEGCPLTRLSVSTKLELSASGTAEGAHASGTLEGHLGESTTYQITVSPDAADEIADGDRDAPNPVDPTTIANGESVLLSEEYYAGLGLSGSYRALQASLGYDRGTRVSSGVQRVSPTTVRVLVGDEDFVRQTLSLGVGIDGASLSVGSSEQLSEGQLHAIDIDISTSAGWSAYQDFLATGTLPEDGATGTTNATSSEVLSYSDETSAEAELGPIDVGGQLGSSEGRRIETTDAEGNVTTVVTSRYNSVGLAIERHRDADGDPIGEDEYALSLIGADRSLLETLQYEGDEDGDLPDDGTVRIAFDESELEDLRQLAREDLAEQVAVNGGDPSADDIAAALEDGDGVIEYDGVEYAFEAWLMGLAAAETPDDILVALYSAPSTGYLLGQLADLLRNQDADLPGDLVAPDCG